jgi:hypothetical protein
VGYVGNNSIHLEQLRAINEEIPGTTPHLDRVPFRQFGRIQTVDASGIGNYHGLSAKLTKRYSQGLTFLSSYTWSKSIDTGSAIRTHDGDTLFPQNSYCLRCERGLSSFHVAHRWVNSILYDVPIGRGRPVEINNGFLNALAGGWQLGSILAWQSGFPLTVVSGRDQSNTGAGFDRPNATGIDPNDIQERTTQRWFNTAAYVLQPFGTFGNVGRNTLIGPGILSWDASLLKDFNITETQRVQFRWEAFNMPNHPNWGNPNANVTSQGYGSIGGTRTNMRQMQLALKYIF